jgi:hypothetical protein
MKPARSASWGEGSSDAVQDLVAGRWHRHRGHNGGTGWDTMAQGGRRTGGQCCGAEVATGEWRNSGNRGGNTSECATVEDLGGDGPDRFGPSVSDWNRKTIMGHFSCGVG